MTEQYTIFLKCYVPGIYQENSLLKLFLFLDRGEWRGKERERNINMWLPLAHPYWGPGLQPRHLL